MEELRNPSLFEKTLKSLFERLIYKCGNNIKRDKEIGCGGVNWFHLAQGPMIIRGLGKYEL